MPSNQPDSSTSNSTCRYLIGSDSKEFVQQDFDDSAWTVGQRAIAPQGAPIWFRCRLPIPSTGIENGLVLELGRIADVESTYFDGALVGSTEMVPRQEWAYFVPRHYFIPPENLRSVKKLATIAVRATSRSFGPTGFVDSAPKILSNWTNTTVAVLEMFPSVAVLIFIAFTRAYPFSSVQKGNRASTIIRMGFCISLVLFFNTFLPYRAFFSFSNLWLRLHIIITSVASLLIFRFIESLTDASSGRWITAWTVIVSAVALLLPGYDNNSFSTPWLARLFGTWGIPVILGGLLASIRVLILFLKYRHRALLPLMVGGVALLLLGGWDIIQLIEGRLPLSLPASGIGFLCFFIGSMFYTLADDREGVIEALRTEYATQAAVAALATQVSHDIRSPLAALQAVFSQIEILDTNSRNQINAAILRIRDIANNLLSQNREAKLALQKSIVRSGIQETPPESTVKSGRPLSKELLWPLLESAVSEKRAQYMDRKAVEIVAVTSEGAQSSFAEVQAGAFSRVLSNLINNAAEAIDRAGHIEVKLEVLSGNALVSIRDSGKGIPKELIERVGERGASFGKKEGNGLGVAYAKEMAKSWNGSLSFKSTVDVGTTVEIKVPLSSAPSWFAETIVVSPGSTIVIADDDISFFSAMQKRFTLLQKSAGAPFTIIHLDGPRKIINWYRENTALENTLLLCDFEFSGSRTTGLDIIDMIGAPSQSVLVTSRWSESSIQAHCEKIGTRILPKLLAMTVQIQI